MLQAYLGLNTLEFSAIHSPEMKLSQSVYFVGSQEKELSHECSTLAAFVRLFVAAAATGYQEAHFWKTEGQELLHLCVAKNFRVQIHCSA